jgi:hypothetical protein
MTAGKIRQNSRLIFYKLESKKGDKKFIKKSLKKLLTIKTHRDNIHIVAGEINT